MNGTTEKQDLYSIVRLPPAWVSAESVGGQILIGSMTRHCALDLAAAADQGPVIVRSRGTATSPFDRCF